MDTGSCLLSVFRSNKLRNVKLWLYDSRLSWSSGDDAGRRLLTGLKGCDDAVRRLSTLVSRLSAVMAAMMRSGCGEAVGDDGAHGDSAVIRRLPVP